MKKHLFNALVISSLFFSSFIFNSCSEYTQGDPNILAQTNGSIQFKITSGKDAGKTFTNSGKGAVVGIKETNNDKFVAYQIVGTFQNMKFTSNVNKESGSVTFSKGSLTITDSNNYMIYSALDDNSGTIKITDIKPSQSNNSTIGEQVIKGKLVFKGKFVKKSVTSSTPLENEVSIEGTVIF